MAMWLDGAPLAPAAVLVGVREGGDHNVIFTRRHEHLAKHAGQVSFPGGGVEPDDPDMIHTALRETQEEIGLPPEVVTPLGYLDCYETISGFCVTPVVARISSRAPALVPNASEVAEVFEVPLGFFLDAANLHDYTTTYRGQPRHMVEFHYGKQRIWGATAAMLLNMLKRMGEPWAHQLLSLA